MPKGDNPNSRRNLLKGNRFSKETASAEGKKGAAISNRVQAEARTFAEELRLLLQESLKDSNGNEAKTQKVISIAMIKKAAKGDVRAYEVIRDTIGQKPTEKVEQVVITPEVDFDKLAELRKALRDE